MSLAQLANQEDLILQTQNLLGTCLNVGDIEAAIALGSLLNDLATARKALIETNKPDPTKQKFNSYTPINGLTYSGRGKQYFPIDPNNKYEYNQQPGWVSQLHRKPEPPKPTTYNWADGFKGVELPMPQHQEPVQQDYWEDQ